MYPIIGLKGQQITAQGNALGVMAAVATPCKGKSIILYLSATSLKSNNLFGISQEPLYIRPKGWDVCPSPWDERKPLISACCS